MGRLKQWLFQLIVLRRSNQKYCLRRYIIRCFIVVVEYTRRAATFGWAVTFGGGGGGLYFRNETIYVLKSILQTVEYLFYKKISKRH